MIYYIEKKELEQYIRVLKNLMGSRLQLAQNCSLSLFCVRILRFCKQNPRILFMAKRQKAREAVCAPCLLRPSDF